MGINVIRPDMSCAFREIYGIHEGMPVEELLLPAYTKTQAMGFGHKFSYFMWSHFHSFFDQCDSYVNYIESRGLGTVKTIGPKKNPNSGNEIKLYIWEINWEAYDAWYLNIVTPKKELLWVRTAPTTAA